MKFDQPPQNKQVPTPDDFKEMLDKNDFNLETFKAYGYGEDLTPQGALELVRQIDLTNDANFREAYISILFLQNFFMEHGEYVKKIDGFMEKIKEKLNRPENNYFLNKFFEETLNGKIYAIDHNQTTTPFLIQKDQYAVLGARDEILLAPKGEKICEEIKDMIEYLDEEAQKASEDWDYHSDPDNVSRELDNMFYIKLKSKDVFMNKMNDKNLPTIDDYAMIIGSGFKEVFEKDFNIKIQDLSIPEQFQFLRYLMNLKVKESERVIDFAKKFKRNAFRTFLSVEHGGKDMGDKILTLAEKLPQESAEKLFAKYSEYIDAVDDVEDFARANFTKTNEINDLIPKTKEAMLLRGYELLRSQADKIENKTFSQEKFDISVDQAKASIDMLKNIFRIAREDDKSTSFEDFVNLNPQEINSTELRKEDEVQIEEIIKKNYPNQELQKQVIESFHNAIKNGTKLNILRREDKVIAVDRTDEKDKDTLYFGSFNVDPDYCSSKIGDAFFQATIAPHMKNKTIEADCSTISPIGAYYIESGFVGETYYSKGGEPSMSIVSKPGDRYESKIFSREEIMKLVDKENINDNNKVKVFSATSQKDLPIHMFEQGKKLTRYFYDKNTKLWYFAFE